MIHCLCNILGVGPQSLCDYPFKWVFRFVFISSVIWFMIHRKDWPLEVIDSEMTSNINSRSTEQFSTFHLGSG